MCQPLAQREGERVERFHWGEGEGSAQLDLALEAVMSRGHGESCFFVVVVLLFRASPAACGGFQARDQIRAI